MEVDDDDCDIRAGEKIGGGTSFVDVDDDSKAEESNESSSKRRRRRCSSSSPSPSPSKGISGDFSATAAAVAAASAVAVAAATSSDIADFTMSGIEKSSTTTRNSTNDVRNRKRLGKISTTAGGAAASTATTNRRGVDASSSPIDDRYLNTIANLVRTLLSDVAQTSDFVADEAARMIRSIGKDQDISMLYETITSANQWRMAISAYKKPLYEHAMFGAIEYRLDRPLDRLVYALLVNQSLTVVYNTYKNWLTDERANAMLSYVTYLENLRRCLESARFRAADETDPSRRKPNDFDETSRAVLRATKFWVWGNCHVLLHQLVRAILLRVNADALRECYVETNEAVSAWFERTVRFIERFRDTTPGDSIESLLENAPKLSPHETLDTSSKVSTKKRNIRSRR